MLLASMILVGCKNNKSNRSVEDEEEDEMEMVDEDEEQDSDDTDEQVAEEREEIDVINARDFLMALKDDVTVNVIVNDPLNLTTAIDQLIADDKLERFYVNGEPRKDPGVFWESEYDGNTLIVAGLKNLTIKGDHEDDGFLIASPRYADVICFYNCENLVIDNFIMGHEETGDCIGDVVVLRKCKNIAVNDCHLYGCGVNGLTIDHSENISVSDTELYGCSNWGINMQDARNAAFKECKVFNNGMGVTANEFCENVVFDKCKFYDNKGQLFMCESEIKVTNSEIEHHHDDYLQNVDISRSKVKMDYSEAQELPDVEHE